MKIEEPSLSRRSILKGGAITAAALAFAGCAPQPATDGTAGTASPDTDDRASVRAEQELADLEKESGVTVGVAAGSESRALIAYRADQLFPMCSLFKTLAVTELLRTRAYDDAFWARNIAFGPQDLVENSPITSKNTSGAMSVGALADAALRYSDNTAGNLLLRQLDGPSGLTAAVRRLGAAHTRLDRWEPALNEALPDDERDTSTPDDIFLLFGEALRGRTLDRLGTARLREWMLRNTTSDERMRAAVPDGVEVADKTGGGSYGVVNDAGVVWQGDRAVTMAIMTRTDDPNAANDNTVVRRAVEIVWRAFA